MNIWNGIGRLTRDPDVRYGEQSGVAVARFSIAINRGKDKDGNDRGADFPNIISFGKTAEFVEKYLSKGQLVGITGKIQTGSYTNKDGVKIFTTEVMSDRIDVLEWGDRTDVDRERSASSLATPPGKDDVPAGFSKLTEDIPF